MNRLNDRWTPASRYPSDRSEAIRLARLQLDFARAMGIICQGAPVTSDRVALPLELRHYVAAARRVKQHFDQNDSLWRKN